MCERDDLEKWDREGGYDWSVNRRQFASLGAAGALALSSPAVAAQGGGLAEDNVRIATADGTIDAFFVRPASGKHPGIVTWPDIAGLRDAFRIMARRLAAQGYAVLVTNPYYRDAPAPQFADFGAFRSNGDKVGAWRQKLTPDAIMRDAKALTAWLDKRKEVDSARGIGSNGYCMTGGFTVYTAAAAPDRVRAGASLHGAGLVKEGDPQSPANMLGKTRARYLFAIAQNDDARDPNAKTVLRKDAEAAGRPAEVEVYHADHGWTVIDSPSYDKAEAERAWGRMSALFAGALKA